MSATTVRSAWRAFYDGYDNGTMFISRSGDPDDIWVDRLPGEIATTIVDEHNAMLDHACPATEHLDEYGCHQYHDDEDGGSCAWQYRCDESGCKRAATMGTPTPAGYRNTCSEHNPRFARSERR